MIQVCVIIYIILKLEHVINFMFMVAEDMREHMAAMGFRTVNEMVGAVMNVYLYFMNRR